ncbi:FAD-dependent oxidoreductase [Aquisediminimonas sediminicola]|uniref:FAD-dependent oxidoreductase n=1 Tax=Alteraquisediminimonas sediminicola TaxID=2676787 RepID=UPI001C8E7404|nr:FAD-dependent oxidoreductase [Aquisediminimonas sediminicola]
MTSKILDRRQLLAGAGIAAVAVTTAACSKSDKGTEGKWDHETDVLCIGSGAAACGAAVGALDNGAKALLVEKMPLLGGTTGKSGGVTWIFNNHVLREQGIKDEKQDALKYLVRYGFPRQYDPNSPTLGLDEIRYKTAEAFYDNGAATIDRLSEIEAISFKQFRMFHVDRPAPDYADHLPENKVPVGRALEPAVGAGSSQGGSSLAAQLEKWLRGKNVPIMTDTRVTRILRNDDRVIGVEAEQGGKTIRIKANKGVVFGSGGYAHNVDLCNLHQPAVYGACALPGSTGDFISLAGDIGAKMGSLGLGWRTQVVLEDALANRAIGLGAFVLPGDSMILVNKYGKRCVNEKRDYNDRTQAHFPYDPSREEYPNHLMFMLFDQRSIDAFGGAFPFPANKGEQPYLIEAPTLDALQAGIAQRLAKLEAHTGGVRLAPEFGANMKAAIASFNNFAVAGKDPEFNRGEHLYDREWHEVFSPRRAGTTQPANPYPNNTMHPIAATGPYYALILAPGALDTAGGPLINEHSQVLGAGDKPISGLYGAGNCISAPTGQAYLGAGGTIGPALTFGFIAGKHAATKGA